MFNMMQELKNYTVYHYTDMNAFINIVRSEGIVMRATNCLYLNDSNEIVEGVKAVERVIKKQIDVGAFRNYYLSSFCQTSDTLQMWGMYAANGAGCALGFDFTHLQNAYGMSIKCTYGEQEIDSSFKNFINLNRNGHLVHMGPNHEEEQKRIDQNKKQIQDEMENNLIITNCLGAKNIAYQNEQERRCVIYANNPRVVQHKVKNGIIVPFVEVHIPKEALKEVVIGPTNTSQIVMQSVIHFLNIKGYDLDKVKVTLSKLPYRG